ncbi:MAG: hypothetical protein IT326_04245 [Anaerolineae bacterium]|nr:hypothetical protein [Anaerolineae bacterium]
MDVEALQRLVHEGITAALHEREEQAAQEQAQAHMIQQVMLLRGQLLAVQRDIVLLGRHRPGRRVRRAARDLRRQEGLLIEAINAAGRALGGESDEDAERVPVSRFDRGRGLALGGLALFGGVVPVLILAVLLEPLLYGRISDGEFVSPLAQVLRAVWCGGSLLVFWYAGAAYSPFWLGVKRLIGRLRDTLRQVLARRREAANRVSG